MTELIIRLEKDDRVAIRSHPPLNPLHILAIIKRVEEVIMHDAIAHLPSSDIVSVSGPEARTIAAQARGLTP